jgi:MOSC domain-containing protein YiiM
VPRVESLNIARTTEPIAFAQRPTGIAKVPVEVREPGPKGTGLGSGLVGDLIGDARHHGGTDQAVYAYARESLDSWEQSLGRTLPSGSFGENLTTMGLEVDDALLGERWRIGEAVVLQVTAPRIPCATFRGWIAERGWLKTFTEVGHPGAYLRVVSGGTIRVGDELEVAHRPAHSVTVALAFRALIREPDLLALLQAAGDDLTDELRAVVASGNTFSLDP